MAVLALFLSSRLQRCRVGHIRYSVDGCDLGFVVCRLFRYHCAHMSDTKIKARFAPSPTGRVHLGNLRTALFNALFARRHDGVFLLRIEDTDEERSRKEFVNDLEEDLLWLGLNWQEGPGHDGGHAPYFQSERTPVYQKYYELLEQQGLAYFCFCSEAELNMSRRRQLAAGQPPRYPGTCARLSREDALARIAEGKLPTLRFRVPRAQVVQFEDSVRGTQQFATEDIGDFIIRRANGTSAFFFCNAIDDALMGVSHVLRGEDHLANTPRQILILKALNLPVPQYGHISMIVGADGAPLSKRHGSRSIRELRESGYLPTAVVNYLARLGHHFESNELLDLNGLAAKFELERLGRSPARFDPEQLLHWQKESIARADNDAVWAWMDATAQQIVPADRRAEFLDAVKPNLVLPPDALRWARIAFETVLEHSESARAVIVATRPDFFANALAAVEDKLTDFKSVAAVIKGSTGAKGKALFEPLRAALTGEVDGPEMGRLLPVIGVERALARLRTAQEMAIG